MIPWLTEDPCYFPDPHSALDNPEGLLAAGGDLSPERLESAYRQGIFPWFGEDEPILWWSPAPRCVIQPNKIHLSRSLRKHIRQSNWQLSFDQCFDDVIWACAEERPTSPGTWITDEMMSAYSTLHEKNLAHSVEVWEQGKLIGGLYGIAIGSFFFGESMFSRQTNASKVAFAALGKQLSRFGYQLIDCQVENPHLLSLGAQLMPRELFLEQLSKGIDKAMSHDWKFDADIATLETSL